MKKCTSYFLVLFLIITINEINAQFISVKDGNWRDPLTWSTDPDATAIPDSNSNVTISHYVIASSGTYVDAECLNLTINAGGVLDNYGSAVVSGSIRIKNDLINNGTISPGYDFWLEVGGNLFNNGIITKHYISQYQRLYIMGNIYNNGSFHFTHTSFSDMSWNPNKTEHSHHIRSLNDSTLYLGETRFLDDLGSLIVDSLAIISGQINLAGSKLILPSSNPYPNNLVLVNAQILSGKIEVNNNIISTQSGSIGYLGNYLGGAKNTIISNANLIGTFVSGGDPTDNGAENLVIFEGETTLEGNLVDWYSGNIWYNGDRGIFIDGTFTNNGNIYDATTDKGLFLNQKDNSTFISNGTLNNKAIIFSGTCNFSVSDSLTTTQFKATDSNTVVNITKGNLIFKDRTVTVDFNNGILNLASNSLFYTTYLWYNLLKNVNVNANNSEIAFAHVGENTTINNARIRYLTCDESTVLSGGTIVIDNGNLLSYSGSDNISILGDIENYGNIINSQSGTLYLSITGNVLHNGNQWSNIETKLNGIDDQNILIPNDSSWTGKVVLDAMLTGTNFQWQKNGADISGANSQIFTFDSGLSETNYGEYKCVVDGNSSRIITIGSKEPSAFEITDVIITNLNDTQTKVIWKTTVPATGFIFYAENDATNGYPLEAMETEGLVLNHSLRLDSLTTGSTYYFIIDQNDENWTNNIRSEEFSFVAGDADPGVFTPFDSALATLKKLTTVPDEVGSAYYDGAFISNDIAYIVTNHNRLFKTTDGGNTWSDVSPEQGTSFEGLGACPKVHFINENVGAVAFSLDDGSNNYDYDVVFGYVWCTVDGGQTWSQRFDVNEDQILHLEQVSENVTYISGAARFGVAGNRWFKKITRDSATATYTLLDITTTPSDRPHLMSGDWLDENNGIVLAKLNYGSYNLSVFRTTDGGSSWSNINGNLPAIEQPQISFSDRGIQMIDEDTFIFSYYNPVGGGYDTKIWTTEDGGVNWFTTEIEDSGVMLNSLSIDKSADYGLICGFNSDSSKIFYVMYVDETQWRSFLLPEVESGTGLYATEMTKDGTIWAIGNNQAIWKSEATGTDVEIGIQSELPTKYALLQNYPNPFNPSTVIEFALPTSGNVSLKVFNSIGEEVAELVNGEMNVGLHSVNFNANNLSSGIYFYRISAGSFIKTNKMILIK